MADTLDLLTADEAKRAINKDTLTSNEDDILARHITAVSRLIDETCGPVVQRTITGEVHDGVRNLILLNHWPAKSITTVREANGSTITTLSAVTFGGTATEGYYADPLGSDPTLLSGTLHRRSGYSESNFRSGFATVQVTYVAGRYADTDHVDARFKDAAGAVLRRLWKREAGTWAQSSDFFVNGDTTAGTGFFRVAAPIISELLWADQQARVG